MSVFRKLKDGLSKTSNSLRGMIEGIFQPGVLTDEFLDDLEAVLIQADVGVRATSTLIETLREEAKKQPIKSEDDLYRIMADKVGEIFLLVDEPLRCRILRLRSTLWWALMAQAKLPR